MSREASILTCVALAHASTTQVSTRGVAAQVLSGVGSRGAGAIFRKSLNVRGLNTAAILWWSAAIGVLAGGGYAACAAIATAFVVFLNLLLRPIVSFINRQPLVSAELEIGYVPDEAHIRALLLQSLATSGLAPATSTAVTSTARLSSSVPPS